MTRPPARTVSAPPAADTQDIVDFEVELTGDPKEHVSTLLSTVAMIGFTVGLTWGLWPHIGPWALCAGAFALALMVSYADWRRGAEPAAAENPDGYRRQPPGRPAVPGPSSSGNLHAKGPGADR